MQELIERLRHELPKEFESSTYVQAKGKIEEEIKARRRALLKGLDTSARERGFVLQETPMEILLVPLRGDRPLSQEELAGLSESERAEIAERQRAFEREIRDVQVRLHTLEHESEQSVRALDEQIIRGLLACPLEWFRRAYASFPEILAHLDAVHRDIVANYRDLLPREQPSLPVTLMEATGRPSGLTRYEVNLLVAHNGAGAPVIVESHLTFAHLIGTAERKARLGVMVSDFTDLRAGALLQASEGYLVMNALDLLRQPCARDALKRVIKTGEVRIEDPSEFLGHPTIGLRLQAVPVDVKVVLVGPPFVYHLLHTLDEDFQKLFKVKADFNVDLRRTEEVDRKCAQMIARLCREEALPHFEAKAVAEVLRYEARLAAHQDRLSLRVSRINDLIRESAFLAQQNGRSLVLAVDVETAMAKRRHRVNLLEERVQDEIQEDTLMVDLDGESVSQVNGLSVHLVGEDLFGYPCRITARTSDGTKGIIDIQRESTLAGHMHRKGVLTLAGYLAGQFPDQPFTLNATLTFEQTSSEVEGDSAAATELVAILSNLAETPIRQWLAITGSVNQHGEIQPIGGVNEKIEGFFESCCKRGLTGRQGVIIPARSVKHLALRPEVVDAVKTGSFHLYAVDSIDEAVELLTGLPEGPEGWTDHIRRTPCLGAWSGAWRTWRAW